MKPVHDKIIKELRAFAKETGVKKFVLGLSGGLDSAVVAVLAARAVGHKNVYAAALPTKYNAAQSLTSAKKLAKNLGINFDVINISPVFESAKEEFKKSKFKKLKPLTEQNFQPRIRAMMLMALSAETGGVVLCCANKSEIYAGYSTLYGDTCGAVAPLAQLYKTEVYELAEYINKDKEIIPSFIITRPPSAELAAGQKDSDDIPEYAILDGIYRSIIDKGLTEKETAKKTGVSIKIIKDVMARKKRNAFKCAQSAPPLRIK